MIKIEFPADRPDLARAFATALTLIANPELQKEVSEAARSTEALERASGPTDAERHKAFVDGETVTITGTTTGHDGTFKVEPAPKPLDDTTSLFGGAAPVDPDTAVDLNGVAFNAEFCSTAKDPFYKSGNKRAGQWKKRQGVEEAAYDTWYAASLDAAPTTASTPAIDTPINTADAFGNATTTPQESAAPVPSDCGSFMGWVSAKQAAQLLTQEEIGAAYKQAGVEVMDLFPPNDISTVAGRVASLYNILVAKAGA